MSVVERLDPRPVTATYRIQFGADVTFDRAGELAGYLADLGVSHLYASPVFQAAPGSTHGYDVIDYNRLSDDLGGRAGFDRMVKRLHEKGLGLILDIVPNHMAASPANPWLADVMRRGRASDHAAAFDIDWEKADGKVVLPVLGAPLDEVVAAGELAVVDDPAFGRAIAYFDKRFPVGDEVAGDLAGTLAAQHYELAYWRDLERLNYRRFFDITDLIGVRMEDEAVFERSHRLLRALVLGGDVDGVRVDHVDGMRDPKAYLDRLAALFPHSSNPPIWVEKIVEDDERLPTDWPVRGETGYAVLPWLDGAITDPVAEEPLTALYADLTGDARSFHDVEAEAKAEIVAGPFAHEFGALSAQMASATGMPNEAVRSVIEDIAKSFPVYRTYLPALGEGDRLRHFAQASRPAHDATVFDAVLDKLCDPAEPMALTFQQMTGPVTAKAVEDTSYYRWHRWSALNEVGGDPSVFGRGVLAFHQRMQERLAEAPSGLSATATHDTKRGEDVRARLAAATHLNVAWEDAARDWFDASEDERRGVADNTAYLLFQTAVGFWPMDGTGDDDGLADRLSAYALKAARERKRDTSWTEQNSAYEGRLTALAVSTCTGPLSQIVRALAARLAPIGDDLSIARAVLKATIPGVPDVYQGTEVTDLSLVDPDNRRAVNWDELARRLADEPTRKMAATRAALHVRRAHPKIFLDGSYEPLRARSGVIAFRRRTAGQAVSIAAAVAPGATLPTIEGDMVLDDPVARIVLAG